MAKQTEVTSTHNVLAKKVTAVLGTLGTAVLAATMRGDWMLILVHFWKQFQQIDSKNTTTTEKADFSDGLLVRYHLEGVHWYIMMSLAVSFSTLFSLTGYLQWYFYIKRRDKAKEWKCQPDKFLTKENERHEILMGTLNMGIGGTASGIIACYIINGGYSTLYYRVSDYGWLYLLLTTPIIFLCTDGAGYYAHRTFHHPWLYKNIHKWHHRYHQPTPFSATAMHPLEFLVYQSILASPAFIIPVHSAVFLGMLLYVYYYGVLDHSGIIFESVWPWQPSSIYHDNHHQYFHTNFGFNTKLWDWLHDTMRRDDRTYGEEIFGGKGKPVKSKDA